LPHWYNDYMLESIGLPELLVVLGVAVLLFGGKKIPEVAKGLGEGIRNFKTALKGDPKKTETPATTITVEKA
jgi:sec-independent protein translocase protein TatA